MLYSESRAIVSALPTVHETSLAFSIFESARRLVGSGRIESVAVSIGELSAVEPDLLRFAWEAIVMETVHSDAQLLIDWKAARQICSSCGRDVERRNGGWEILCSECGRPLRLDGGLDLEIVRITYLETGATENGGSKEPGNTSAYPRGQR